MMPELNILIVEDEVFIAEMIVEALREYGYHKVVRAKSYADAISFLEKDTTINFAFLDINLGGKKSGIDLAHKLNNTYSVPFVYLTSNTDSKTIQEAGVTLPAGYLSKPFRPHELLAAIKIGESKLKLSEKTFVIKDGHEHVKLITKDIISLMSDNNYVTINMTGKKYVIRKSLEKFLDELNCPLLLRVHRSYVVNLSKVKTVNGKYVIVDDEKIPMSRKYKDEVMSRFSM